MGADKDLPSYGDFLAASPVYTALGFDNQTY
jgi:hypothetical protein